VRERGVLTEVIEGIDRSITHGDFPARMDSAGGWS
jgi:hypothetical protein